MVLAAVFLVVMVGLIAFAVDIGYVGLVRTQLQAAADSSALAAAGSVNLPRADMEAVAKQFAAANIGRQQARSTELLRHRIRHLGHRRRGPSRLRRRWATPYA